MDGSNMDDEGVPPLNEGSTEDGLAEHKTGMNSWTLGNQGRKEGKGFCDDMASWLNAADCLP